MPTTSPRARARKFLRWLEKEDRVVSFRGTPVFSDEVEFELARLIADALDELREGFLRKPRKDPTTNG